MAYDPAVMIPDMDAITKERFAPGNPYWDWLNRGTVSMDLIEADANIRFLGKSEGKRLVFPVQTDDTPNPAVAYPTSQRRTGLPKPGKAEMKQIIYNHATHVQSLEFEGDMASTVDGGEASTTDGLAMQMRDQGIAARAEFNKVINGDGSGAITGIISAVNNVLHQITVPSTSRLKVGTQFVAKGGLTGLRIDTGSSQALEVTDVISATIFEYAYEDGTFPTAMALPANVYCYRYDGQGASVLGFGAFCDSADPTNWGSPTQFVGGMSRVTEPLWRATQHDAGGDLIDIQSDVQVILDNMTIAGGNYVTEVGDGVVWYAFTGYQNHRVLENALTSNVTTSPQSKIIKGHIGIQYENAFFVKEKDAPPDEVRFVHSASMYRHVIQPWYWLNRTGAIWTMQKADDGRDADIYRAYMMTRQQLCACRCNTMGRIINTNATR